MQGAVASQVSFIKRIWRKHIEIIQMSKAKRIQRVRAAPFHQDHPRTTKNTFQKKKVTCSIP